VKLRNNKEKNQNQKFSFVFSLEARVLFREGGKKRHLIPTPPSLWIPGAPPLLGI